MPDDFPRIRFRRGPVSQALLEAREEVIKLDADIRQLEDLKHQIEPQTLALSSRYNQVQVKLGSKGFRRRELRTKIIPALEGRKARGWK